MTDNKMLRFSCRMAMGLMLIWQGVGNTSSLLAQTSKDDLVQLNKTYSNAKSFSMDVRVQLFDNNSDVSPSASYLGTVKKQGAYYFNEIMNQITVKSTNCLLTIDKSNKRITYKPMPVGSKEMVDSDPSVTIDSLLKTYKSVSLVSSTATNRTYALTSNSPRCIYEKVHLTIDTKLFTLQSVDFYYKYESVYSRIHINYSNIYLNQTIPDSWFDVSKYVTVKGSEVTPSTAYKGYKVVKINNNFIINN